MAVDNSPVQNRIIVVVGALVLLLLVGLKFVFDSYFADMTDEVMRSKLVDPVALKEHREAEQKRLTSGPMPIDKAMADLAAKGRSTPDSLGPDLTPKQSDDLTPMAGWVKLPHEVPHAAAPAATDAGVTTVPAADAGAAPTTAGDAGAAVPPPAAKDAGAAPAPQPHDHH
jgi:hypothetical protein